MNNVLCTFLLFVSIFSIRNKIMKAIRQFRLRYFKIRQTEPEVAILKKMVLYHDISSDQVN